MAPEVYISLDEDGLFVSFLADYYNFDGEVTILWDFGDGVGTSDYQWPTYTYAEAGEYLVTVTVTEVSGAQRSVTASETIVLTLPVGLSITSVIIDGLTVTFTATVENPVEGYAFWWDFGDGTDQIDSSTVTHTYSQSGDYEVNVAYVTEGPTLDEDWDYITVSGPTNVLWGARVFGTARTP